MPDWWFFLDELKTVCGVYCLQYWQTVGVWLTGFATVSAVVVSLTLARRQRPRLRISAGIRMIVQQGAPGAAEHNFPRFVAIAIRNIGDRPAKIEGVGWRSPRWNKINGYQQLPPQPTGVTLPYVLPDGDSLHLYISIDDPEIAWIENFARDFLGPWPSLDVRFIRVMAWTPAGYTFQGPLEDELRKRLVAEKRKPTAETDAA